MLKSTNKYVDALTYTLIASAVFCVVYLFQTGETVRNHIYLTQVALQSYEQGEMGVVFTVMVIHLLSVLVIVFGILAIKEFKNPNQKQRVRQ